LARLLGFSQDILALRIPDMDTPPFLGRSAVDVLKSSDFCFKMMPLNAMLGRSRL
jgi:hypothetical protein